MPCIQGKKWWVNERTSEVKSALPRIFNHWEQKHFQVSLSQLNIQLFFFYSFFLPFRLPPSLVVLPFFLTTIVFISTYCCSYWSHWTKGICTCTWHVSILFFRIPLPTLQLFTPPHLHKFRFHFFLPIFFLSLFPSFSSLSPIPCSPSHLKKIFILPIIYLLLIHEARELFLVYSCIHSYIVDSFYLWKQ